MSHSEKQATYSKRYYSQPDKREMKRQYNQQYQLDHKELLSSIRKLKQKGKGFKGGLTIDKQEIVLSFN